MNKNKVKIEILRFDALEIFEGMEAAHSYFYKRDEMNSMIHVGDVMRLSPITVKVGNGLMALKRILVDAEVLAPEDASEQS